MICRDAGTGVGMCSPVLLAVLRLLDARLITMLSAGGAGQGEIPRLGWAGRMAGAAPIILLHRT
jgi:hypothetical protein